MNRHHKDTDIQQILSLNVGLDTMINLYVIVIDSVSNQVKFMSVYPAEGFITEDITVIDNFNIEVRIKRSETLLWEYGNYHYLLKATFTDPDFENSERVESNSELIFRIVQDIVPTLDNPVVDVLAPGNGLTEQDIIDIKNLSGINTGDQDLSGKENVGVAASLDAAHLSAYDHTKINHNNRTALDVVSGTNTGDQDLSNLVVKETGKGLSTNDFTDALESKLNGIEDGATVQIQSDWNQTDNGSVDFIKNKPSISGGHIIQDEGVSLATRSKLNFKGAGVTVTDNSAADSTDVTITGGSGSYTDEEAQDAVGNILNNSGNVQFTYDDLTPKITANVDLSGKENASNKSTDTSLGTSDTLFPTQRAVKTYADTKQAALGFTPENVANKATSFQSTPDNIKYPSEKLVKDSLDLKLNTQAIVDSKGISGFIDGSNIDVSYNYTNRTVTLTGNLTYYWRGEVKNLTSPWTSSAHTNSVGMWHLATTDGDNFAWSNTVWSFADVMVSVVNRGATASASFAIKETHELMDYQSHNEFHSQIGTYKASGGTLTAGTYTENVASDAANSPGFNAATVKDEDLLVSVNSWPEGTYTTAYVGASNSLVFSTNKTRPFHDSGADSYIQINNTSAGTMVAGMNNRYYNVYQILVPVCSDVDSQRYRMIMLQPQVEYTSLAAAQGENIAVLNLGNFSSLFTEFVFHARITYRTRVSDTNAGKCRIETGGISYVTTSKSGQLSISGVAPSNHQALSNLTWDLSGHIGTASQLPAFDANGLATYFDPTTKVTANAGITVATKTKITYDAKGLVTAGADATTADIADSSNKRYVTDAQLTVIGNTSGTNTGDNATNTQYSGLASSKQNTLVSGTNIKTVNGNSLLGSGDLTISGGGGLTFAETQRIAFLTI